MKKIIYIITILITLSVNGQSYEKLIGTWQTNTADSSYSTITFYKNKKFQITSHSKDSIVVFFAQGKCRYNRILKLIRIKQKVNGFYDESTKKYEFFVDNKRFGEYSKLKLRSDTLNIKTTKISAKERSHKSQIKIFKYSFLSYCIKSKTNTVYTRKKKVPLIIKE